jgi:transposase-like protein
MWSPVDHLGRLLALSESAAEFFPEAGWQRCIVHFYRNIFSHVPSTKAREIAAMLKAIHAGEDIVAARQKAVQVIEKLRGLRLTRAAELVAAAAEETLTYYAFPEEHWRRIPTTDEIDKRFFVNRATPQVHSFVRPRHRSFFRPGRRFLEPPRAGAVKAGRIWGDRKARP